MNPADVQVFVQRGTGLCWTRRRSWPAALPPLSCRSSNDPDVAVAGAANLRALARNPLLCAMCRGSSGSQGEAAQGPARAVLGAWTCCWNAGTRTAGWRRCQHHYAEKLDLLRALAWC